LKSLFSLRFSNKELKKSSVYVFDIIYLLFSRDRRFKVKLRRGGGNAVALSGQGNCAETPDGFQELRGALVVRALQPAETSLPHTTVGGLK
jgi:hypothetical protein